MYWFAGGGEVVVLQSARQHMLDQTVEHEKGLTG